MTTKTPTPAPFPAETLRRLAADAAVAVNDLQMHAEGAGRLYSTLNQTLTMLESAPGQRPTRELEVLAFVLDGLALHRESLEALGGFLRERAAMIAKAAERAR